VEKEDEVSIVRNTAAGGRVPGAWKWKDEVERLGAVLGAYRDLAMLVREIDHLKGKLRYAGQSRSYWGQ